MPAVLNAANEVAVRSFLDGRIGFTDIAEINRLVMSAHTVQPAGDIDSVLDADSWARGQAENIAAARSTAVSAPV